MVETQDGHAPSARTNSAPRATSPAPPLSEVSREPGSVPRWAALPWHSVPPEG